MPGSDIDANLLAIGVALVIGLVIGAEREQRIAVEKSVRKSAGIRTFALTALLGVVAAILGTPMLVAMGVAVAAAATVAYALDARLDPGLTTEIALLLTYALGALASVHPMLALPLGLTTAVLLAFRSRIHEMVRDILTPAELRDALIVASAAIVVLPVLPEEPIDPWGVLVPFTLWRLVVLVLAIHLAAHVAQRMLGPRWGPPLAGLASGFVSSAATIMAMGQRAKSNDEHTPSALASAAASTVATYVEVAILVGAVSPLLLGRLAPALAVAGLVAAGFTTWLAWRAAHEVAVTPHEMERPVNVRGALLFALVVTGISIASSFLQRSLGDAGAVVGAAVAAFADSHAASVSIANVFASGGLAIEPSAAAVLACLTTNALTKIVMAGTGRPPRRYTLLVAAQVALATLASWLVLELVP